MIIRNGLAFLPEEGFVKKDLQIQDGKIFKIADLIENTNQDAEYDAEGLYIMPGMIDAHSHIGLFNESMRWEGEDGNEMTDPFTPEMNAIDAINPFDESFEDALRGGVTTACTGPGSANVVGGSFATISLYGKVADQMVIDYPAAMKCAFGENPKSCYGQNGEKSPMTRMGVGAVLRDGIIRAQNYKAKKEEAIEKEELFEIDPKMEALLPVLEKKIPLKAHAHRADDICTAIRIAKEFDLKLTLEHCTEGHMIADYLKETGLPAMVGPTFGNKSKIELMNKTFDTAKILVEKGIKIAIITDHPVIPQSSLNLCAALAMKAGLPEREALKAVTINPAGILGIDHLKGQLKEGLDADLAIWEGHPLDLQAQTKKVFVKGIDVFENQL